MNIFRRWRNELAADNAPSGNRRLAAGFLLVLNWAAGIEGLAIILYLSWSVRLQEAITCILCLTLLCLFATLHRLYSAMAFALITAIAFSAVIGFPPHGVGQWINLAALFITFMTFSGCIVLALDKLKRTARPLQETEGVNFGPQVESQYRETRHSGAAVRQDVMPRVRVAEELKAGFLDELSAAMAHEIAQPLSALVMDGQACLRWLRHDNPPKSEIQDCVERMTSDGRRASEILKRIRDLIRRPSPELQPTGLNEVIQDAVADLTDDFQASRIRLRLDLSPSLPKILADSSQLRQVILNLCINSIEATQNNDDDANVLQISTSTLSGSRIDIRICDAGSGIAITPVEQIFEPFVSDKAGRLGLGLPVCRSIVEAHDGTIAVMNNIGSGATVVVSFRTTTN